MKITAIIAAGGIGSRMKSEKGKLFLELAGIPILELTLRAFEENRKINEIIIPAFENDIQKIADLIKSNGFKKIIKIIKGGDVRQTSVYNAVKEVSVDSDYVLVHDGARPFISQIILDRVIEQVVIHKAVVVAVKAKDTIKIVDENGLVKSTPDRNNIWQIQTPQAFTFDIVKSVYEKAEKDGFIGTDDSMLAERAGIQVKIVEGSYENIKVTTPEDICLGESILKSRQ